MCDPISIGIGALVGGGVLGAVQGSKNRAVQKEIQAQNVDIANNNAQRSEEQFNRLNQKMPGIAAMYAANKAGAGKGIGSTFLTGSAGVAPGKYTLGGGSLLGS